MGYHYEMCDFIYNKNIKRVDIEDTNQKIGSNINLVHSGISNIRNILNSLKQAINSNISYKILESLVDILYETYMIFISLNQIPDPEIVNLVSNSYEHENKNIIHLFRYEINKFCDCIEFNSGICTTTSIHEEFIKNFVEKITHSCFVTYVDSLANSKLFMHYVDDITYMTYTKLYSINADVCLRYYLDYVNNILNAACKALVVINIDIRTVFNQHKKKLFELVADIS